ncbi:IS3 family transposase [Streptococcus pneumoniae]|uniref:IS3 family transposase n=1 Tax=Streptococcus pneumoniae TaxID=1313 RepID=UPI001032D353
MNCPPKVRQKKSNFWGVFIMKLTYDDKVQIYELNKRIKVKLKGLSPVQYRTKSFG